MAHFRNSSNKSERCFKLDLNVRVVDILTHGPPLKKDLYRYFLLKSLSLSYLWGNLIEAAALILTWEDLHRIEWAISTFWRQNCSLVDLRCGLKGSIVFSSLLFMGNNLAIISIFSATFCLAQPKQVNTGLKIIFGSSNIHLDHVLANKIFLISFIDFWDIIRLRCKSDEILHSITNAPCSDNILKIYFAYQKYFVAQDLVQVYVWTAKYVF